MSLSAVANGEALIKAEELRVYFPVTRGALFRKKRGWVRAVDQVSFTIRRGETLGLVGESGCGKTTTGLALIQLRRLTGGSVFFREQDLASIRGVELRRVRRYMQMVFQDPFASLNPRLTVGDIVGEPIVVHQLAKSRSAVRAQVRELLDLVGLDPRADTRYPHEFSGGQRQRIGIARALAASPEFVVCDEPVSSLDVSIQAQILNLLQVLQSKFNLTYLFIAHDLAVVRHISDRIAVMYLGKIVELAGRHEIYRNPQHPYTKALLSAVPIPDPPVERRRERIILTGDVPSPIRPPAGCRFSTRCPRAESRCFQEHPALEERSGHFVACHLIH